MATIVYYPTKEESTAIKNWLFESISDYIEPFGCDIKRELNGTIPEIPKMREFICKVEIRQEWANNSGFDQEPNNKCTDLVVNIGQVFAVDTDGQDYSIFMDNTDLQNNNLYLE